MANEHLERLAALEHEQWSHWTRYMLDELKKVVEYHVPSVDQKAFWEDEVLRRWRRQIDTGYEDLSEEEKESDREWAHKAFEVMLPFIRGQMAIAGEPSRRIMEYLYNFHPPSKFRIIHDQIELDPAQDPRMVWDRMLTGTSFSKGSKHVDPKHVMLKEDGTYEVSEPKTPNLIDLLVEAGVTLRDLDVPLKSELDVPTQWGNLKSEFYSGLLGAPFRNEVMGVPPPIDNPCPGCGAQLQDRKTGKPDFKCPNPDCNWSTQRPQKLRSMTKVPSFIDRRRPFGSMGTTTGRMPSGKPNMANKPRSEDDVAVHKCLRCKHLIVDDVCMCWGLRELRPKYKDPMGKRVKVIDPKMDSFGFKGIVQKADPHWSEDGNIKEHWLVEYDPAPTEVLDHKALWYRPAQLRILDSDP